MEEVNIAEHSFKENTVCQSYEIITSNVPKRKDITFSFNTLTPLICPSFETVFLKIHFCLRLEINFQDGALFYYYIPLNVY